MDLARIKARLHDIANRRSNVRFSEVANLLDNHIGAMFPNYNHHGSPHHAFTLGPHTFNIAEPKRGNLKKVYVDRFLECMEDLGLYDPEESP